MTIPPLLTWHQALVYSVTGTRVEELGRQRAPDLASVADYLRSDPTMVTSASFVVPADLLQGIGAAQFAAALASLRARLVTSPPVVARPRPLDAGERRLLADAPPHHGS